MPVMKPEDEFQSNDHIEGIKRDPCGQSDPKEISTNPVENLKLLWTPTKEAVSSSKLEKFRKHVNKKFDLHIGTFVNFHGPHTIVNGFFYSQLLGLTSMEH